MAVEDRKPKRNFRKIAMTATKAAIKAVFVFVIYVIVSRLLTPVSTYVPNLPQMIQTFVIVYATLMIIGDLTSGTVFQHIFGAAKSGFVIAYLIVSLNSGVLAYTFGNVSLMVDLRAFMIVAMMLGLLGMARSVIQEIDFLSHRAELGRT